MCSALSHNVLSAIAIITKIYVYLPINKIRTPNKDAMVDNAYESTVFISR